MGVLDASMVFFLPLGIDFVLIVMTARKPQLFWLYALDRKSTRLNSSHTEIYTLSLHDALPIYGSARRVDGVLPAARHRFRAHRDDGAETPAVLAVRARSEEHTSELQSHRDLHSFPTRRSSDLWECSTRRWCSSCRSASISCSS